MAGVPIVMGWQLTCIYQFSGPLFALLVSYSWHRNRPASLCWLSQNRIFVRALWFVKLCLGIDLSMWTCRGYTVLPSCCKLSEPLTHIDIKCQSAKSLPWCEVQPPGSLCTVDWVANQFVASMAVASHTNYCPRKARRLVSYQLLWGEDKTAEQYFRKPVNPCRHVTHSSEFIQTTNLLAKWSNKHGTIFVGTVQWALLNPACAGVFLIIGSRIQGLGHG